jgi:hypothetical protein
MTQRGNDSPCRAPSKSTGLPQLLLLAVNLGGSNWGVSTYQMEEGGIVHAFVLYFDAFFQAITLAKPDLTYQVIAANELIPETFKSHDRHGFNVYLQTAFAARQGQLLAGPDGRPLGFIRRLRQDITAPSVFLVDSAATAEIAHLYEHAGLFAWQETSANVETWDVSRILRSVVQASMSVLLCEDGDYDQLAIFDPEFGQWHFVPRTVVD